MGIFDRFRKRLGPPTAKWTGKAYKCPKCGAKLTSFLLADVEPMGEEKNGYVTCLSCGTQARLPQEKR